MIYFSHWAEYLTLDEINARKLDIGFVVHVYQFVWRYGFFLQSILGGG